MSFIWVYFWDIKWIFLVLLFILFSFFFELKSSSLNSICLMLFLFTVILIDLTFFNFDSILKENHSLLIFLLSFMILFTSIYFWQVFFSKLNQKMEFSTLVLFIFVLGFFIFKSTNMLELFLVIEGLSFSAYILAGFEKDTKISSSVGIQYLILGSISSIFLMLAFLLVYNQFGSAVFVNLFLANLEFLKDYFFTNDHYSLETFLSSDSFIDTSKEDVVSWSLGLFGAFNFKKFKNFGTAFYYAIQSSLVSFFMLRFFCSNKMDDFKMSVSDFSYLSSKDFSTTLVLGNYGESGNNPYIKFENPINMATVEVPKKFENYEITSKYQALTGLSENKAIKFAEGESNSIKECLIEGFKHVDKTKEKEETIPTLSDYLEKVSVLKEQSFLPKRWRFKEEPIANWDSIQKDLLEKNSNFDSIEDLAEEIRKRILDLRLRHIEYISSEESILVPDEKGNDFMDFNFRVLQEETSLSCTNWWHIIKANLGKDPFDSTMTADKLIAEHLESSWFSSEESFNSFITHIRRGIKMDGMTFEEYGPSAEQLAGLENPFYLQFDFIEFPSFENFNLGQFDFSIYGTILIVIGFLIGTLLYKIKGAPFHIWAPTIYTRMPTASLVVLMTLFTFIFSLYFFQLFLNIFYLYGNIIAQLFLMSGLLSLLFGFLGAFDQKLLKKFFIYSSIGHVAFLLFTFTFFSSIKSELGLVMYLFIYLISTFLLWYLITFNSSKIEFLSNVLKPVKNNNLFLFVFIVITFSMSGIPPLAGFYIKFDILNLLAFSQEFFVLFVSLLITVASFYYYLRLLKIANFENFTTSLTSLLKVEESWSFLRLFFLFLSSFLLFLFVVIIEQSFYYLNSYLF